MNYILLLILIIILFFIINSMLKKYIENFIDYNNITIKDRVKYYMNENYYKKIIIHNKLYSKKNYIINKDNNITNNIKNDYKIYKLL